MFEPNFDASEYDARLAKTRTAMAESGFDVLVVGDPANINYLTGYNAWSFYTPQVLIIPAAGDLVFYTREVDASGAVMTTRLSESQVRAFPERYVHQPDCHPMDWIAADMMEKDLGRGTVAVEMDTAYYTVRAHKSLENGLPGATIVSAQELVNWVRSVKSDLEIAKMRTAGKIMTNVMTTALDFIEPGVRQCDAVAEIYATAVRGLPDAGGDFTAIVPMIPTGPGTGIPHLTWSDKPFKQGEATVLELGACYERYHSPLARTIFLGQPPERLVSTADIVSEGMEAALAAVRPGVLAEDVERAWRDVISRYGLTKATRIGYSIGVGYPPDWGERTISLRPGDKTALVPNMTFHMILGMWMDGWGYELSESFVVTETGHERFASVPWGLTVK
ncbi:ectoine hydrolase [Nocardioides sp. J9]|nr:ectoine hydrolase [Nocardioides sp. J9]